MKPLIRKSWYTLTEAADYLTRSTEGGPVTVSDVLQLALEGDLEISLLVTEDSETPFRFALIQPCSELTEEQMQEIEKNTDSWPENPLEGGLTIDGEIYYSTRLSTNYLYIDVWDIVWSISGEELFSRLWVKSKGQNMSDPDSFNPTIIKTARRFGLEIQLVDTTRQIAYSIPTHAIPNNSYLVVKRVALERILTDDTITASARPDKSRQYYPPQLEALTIAWRKYWQNADPTDRTACPKKPDVVAWLIAQGFSAKNADAGATIIKPQWAIDKGW